MEINKGLIVQSILVVIASFLLLVYWIFRRKHDYWRKRGVPFLKPVLLLGNLQFMGRRSVWDFFFELKEKFREDYIGIYLAWQPTLVVHKPELAKTILVKDFDYFQDRYIYSRYTESDPIGSLNLFNINNPVWSEMRNKLTPLFTTARLKMLTDLMSINALQLVDKIRRDGIEKKELLTNEKLFHMYASETMASSVFGLKTSSLKGEYSPIWIITRYMLKWDFRRGMEFLLIFFVPKVADLLRLKFFSKAATEHLRKLFWGIIEERQKSGTLHGQHKDLINHLLKLKSVSDLPKGSDSKFLDELMLAQAGVFFLGSIETSTSTLTYTLHELSHHPEEQEKLYKEVSEAFEKSGKDVLSYDELMEMKYLGACAYETIRKYPPVPYLDRICSKPYKLDGKLTIEKGTPVFINLAAIHHDEKIWPNPKQWNPDRMLNMNDNDTLDFTYLPFGVGPRFCIGKRYGMLQVRIALSQIIRKYKLEPGPSPYDVKSNPFSIIMIPDGGGLVKYVPRE